MAAGVRRLKRSKRAEGVDDEAQVVRRERNPGPHLPGTQKRREKIKNREK
jgi:hypothetical protein